MNIVYIRSRSYTYMHRNKIRFFFILELSQVCVWDENIAHGKLLKSLPWVCEAVVGCFKDYKRKRSSLVFVPSNTVWHYTVGICKGLILLMCLIYQPFFFFHKNHKNLNSKKKK